METREQDVTVDDPSQSVGRRELIKALAVTGGMTAVQMSVPGRWLGPLVEIGVLPAHAATSSVSIDGTAACTATADPFVKSPQPGYLESVTPEKVCPGDTVTLSGRNWLGAPCLTLKNKKTGATVTMLTFTRERELSADSFGNFATTITFAAPEVPAGKYDVIIDSVQGRSGNVLWVEIADCDMNGDMDSGTPGGNDEDPGTDASMPKDAGVDGSMPEMCEVTGTASDSPGGLSVPSQGCPGATVEVYGYQGWNGMACIDFIPATFEDGGVTLSETGGVTVSGQISSGMYPLLRFKLPNDIAPGDYQVTVRSADGEYISEWKFTVIAAPVPTVTSISATSAKVGDELTIMGENFADVTGVGFEGEFTSIGGTIVSQTDTKIVVSVNMYAPDGVHRVVLGVEGAGYCQYPATQTVDIDNPGGGTTL